jgi:hypothetical protein
MDNIYRGEPILKENFIKRLSGLESQIQEDILLPPLSYELVIEALYKLTNEINIDQITKELVSLGIPEWTSQQYIKVTVESVKREALKKKLYTELGDEPFVWNWSAEGIEERYVPLGVILHIGAGNALGLSAFSVIEGLLCGNINILKLPENEGGLSSRILMKLIQIQPKLKPYIYVLDVSSKDTEVISELIKAANAVVVWGSDEAISAVRRLSPPYLPIIEWGHRYSFAYFTKRDDDEGELEGLAKDICFTEQLYCSSPQCVFYESDDIKELDIFADRLAKHMEAVTAQYPSGAIPMDAQAQITWTHEFVKLEEILKEKRLITNGTREYGVMVDYKSELKASPLFRNIWVMPIYRRGLFNLLREHKGHLQTVGLSCREEEFEELSKIFYAAGINRITNCGGMSSMYIGEPHDGAYALQRYVRKVNRRKIT